MNNDKRKFELPQVPVGRFSLFGLDFVVVFKHRFEKNNEDTLIDKFSTWREWNLGFFFRKSKFVGKRGFNNPKKWKSNHVNKYKFGINLLICKAWFTVARKGAIMKINLNK